MLTDKKECPDCGGTGRGSWSAFDCETCNGKGEVEK